MAMNEEEPKFPNLRPIRSAPWLIRVNGCGLGMYGGRDHDPETGTFVKTHCLCIVFVPILAIGAYRVAKAPGGGWYFLGKEPLSAFAKAWGLLILLGAVILGGVSAWDSHTKSPDYVAGQKLDEADTLAKAGQIGKAANLYREVAIGSSEKASDAAGKLKGLLEGPMASAPAEESAKAFRTILDVQKFGRITIPAPELFQKGLALADRQAATDPKGARRFWKSWGPCRGIATS